MNSDPHGKQGIVQDGAALTSATGAIILLHGRGGSAADILGLGQALAFPDWALLAPQAADHSWYPYSFLAPRAENEPYLSSALAKVKEGLEMALNAGVPGEKIFLAGFSQGACLASEFVGRHPQRYGALLAFTGGLIGPPDEPIRLAGNLLGTPVLLSSGDPDPHVPWTRVEQTGELLSSIGAHVTLRRYPGRAYTIVADEMVHARALLASETSET